MKKNMRTEFVVSETLINTTVEDTDIARHAFRFSSKILSNKTDQEMEKILYSTNQV